MSWLETQRARGRRPFPVESLAPILGLDPGDPLLTGKLALSLGMNRGWVRRCRALGLSEEQADVWATRVGLTLGEVWPAWWQGLTGVTLVAANRLTCTQGHALDRVDSAGRRRCGPCPLAAVRRYRERKKLVRTAMTPIRQHRALGLLLDDGMAQMHGSRERLVTLLPPDLSQWIDQEATAMGLSRSAWACMKLAEVRTAEAAQPEQVAS